MRGLTLLLLVLGPGLAAPAAAGVWAWRTQADPRLAALLGIIAALVVAGAEFALVRRRGVARQVAVLALSGFWVVLAWLGISQNHRDWTTLPVWRMPGAGGQMIILLGVLIWLMLYHVADGSRSEPQGRPASES